MNALILPTKKQNTVDTFCDRMCSVAPSLHRGACAGTACLYFLTLTVIVVVVLLPAASRVIADMTTRFPELFDESQTFVK
jgi:hypothetical protein